MASYAPLLVNYNDRWWTLDAIAFNSSKHYGTPNYWVPKFFIELSGATLFDAKLQTNFSTLVASAITWQNSNGETYLKIKVVPAQTLLKNADKDMQVVLTPFPSTSFHLLTESNNNRMPQTDSFSRSSI
ncbi:hypothetical protein H0E87_029913 [Populus deltoides]|uniref:Alpha-L-arabinofuranosidase C-terminal domain-containing protein n=1 Tax=Populus deltoides TaxID=3696 RepID=A0A8T2WPD9_POPDE|nr:hypothetical protein H0E87_029913 [Populus deltoides]